MASKLSNYLANAVLGWIRAQAMPAAPATCYVALYNGDPTATGLGGTEITTTVRPAGRVAIPWSAVASREIQNTADIAFGESAADASITHLAIFDASDAGNMLGWNALNTPRSVVAGDPVAFLAGDLRFNFSLV